MSDRPLFRKTMTGFQPYNTAGQEQFDRIKLGEIAEMKTTLVRNGKFHRLFFAILRLISENSNPHISEAAALHYAKTAAGCGEFEPTGNGTEMRFIPGSISFAAMDQAEFDAFVKAAVPPLVNRFMRGTAPDDLVREALEVAA